MRWGAGDGRLSLTIVDAVCASLYIHPIRSTDVAAKVLIQYAAETDNDTSVSWSTTTTEAVGDYDACDGC